MANNSELPAEGQLDRVLGPWTATAIVVGTIIGSGIFKKPAAVAEDLPQFGVAMSAWLLMAVLIMFGALALAEVTVLFPRAGGNYVFLREAYGRAFGFMWGWMDFMVIRTASIAALAVIFAESLHDMLRQMDPEAKPVFTFWQVNAIALGTIFVLGLVNVRGVRWGGGLQFLLTLIKVGGVILMALLPFGIIRLVEGAPTPTTENWQPLWPTERQPFELALYGSALIAVLWPFHGWQNLGPIAGEVKRPQWNIPIALILGLSIVALLYLALNLSYALVIPSSEMATLKGQSVAAVFCRKLIGPYGAAVAAGVVMCSVFGALNGNILVGPRLLFAMGEDGLAPRGLKTIHRSYRTPASAIMVYTLWSMVLLFGGALSIRIVESQQHQFTADTLKISTDELDEFRTRDIGWKEIAKTKGIDEGSLSEETITRLNQKRLDPFDVLTNFAMFGAVVFETLVVASIFVFRWKYPDVPRPYRCPGYPIVPAIHILAFLGVLASYFVNESKRLEALTGVCFTLAGAAVYLLFLRKRR